MRFNYIHEGVGKRETLSHCQKLKIRWIAIYNSANGPLERVGKIFPRKMPVENTPSRKRMLISPATTVSPLCPESTGGYPFLHD